jgi:hypothetical protein
LKLDFVSLRILSFKMSEFKRLSYDGALACVSVRAISPYPMSPGRTLHVTLF